MKNRIDVLIIVLMLFVALSGCTKSGEPDEQESDAATETAVQVIAPTVEANSYEGDAQPVSFVGRLPGNNRVENATHFMIFNEGKQVSSGEGHKGSYIVDLLPGTYTAAVRYGVPLTWVLTPDIVIEAGNTTFPIVLPYSEVIIQPQTEDGYAPTHSYANLIVSPVHFAPYQTPWIWEGDNRPNPVPLELIEGVYETTVAWMSLNGESKTVTEQFDVIAGQPMSVTLDVMPNDGHLLVNTQSEVNHYAVSITVKDDKGETVTAMPNQSRNNQTIPISLPVYVGNYTVTVKYLFETPIIHEFPIEIQSGGVTNVLVTDDPDATPGINLIAP